MLEFYFVKINHFLAQVVLLLHQDSVEMEYFNHLEVTELNERVMMKNVMYDDSMELKEHFVRHPVK